MAMSTKAVSDVLSRTPPCKHSSVGHASWNECAITCTKRSRQISQTVKVGLKACVRHGVVDDGCSHCIAVQVNLLWIMAEYLFWIENSAGHMVRMKDERSLKISETKKHGGCGKRGRSQLRWEDCVDRDLRKA